MNIGDRVEVRTDWGFFRGRRGEVTGPAIAEGGFMVLLDGYDTPICFGEDVLRPEGEAE